MDIVQQLQQKVSERHNRLLSYRKVMIAMKRAGVNQLTYNRAVAADATVQVPTLERIAKAQMEVIKEYEQELANV